MSAAVGFRLTGRYPEPPPPRDPDDGFLRACEDYFDAAREPYPIECIHGVDLEDRPSLFVQVFPAAEPLFITDVGGGRFLAWANTAAVGAGYHMHLCELFHDLGAHLRLTIDPPGTVTDDGQSGDSTSYFFTRDRAAVARKHLDSLAAICRNLAGTTDLEPGDRLTLSMASGVEFEAEHPILTTMGPRPLSWAAAGAENPAAAIDALPWHHPGQRARYHLGRALARMWCDVHWVRPTFNPDRNACFEALHALAAAYEEDPALDYPWREWHELIGLARQAGEKPPPFADDVARRAAEVPAERPRIGYRRRDVTHHVGDWRVRLPGGFVVQPPPPAGGWMAFHVERRGVHLNVMPMDPKYGAGPAGVDRFLADKQNPVGKRPIGRFVHQGRYAKGLAFLFKEPDGGPDNPTYVLTGISAVPGRFVVRSTGFHDLAAALAVSIWRSIDLGEPD